MYKLKNVVFDWYVDLFNLLSERDYWVLIYFVN